MRTFTNGKHFTFGIGNTGFLNIPLIFKAVSSIKQNLEADLNSLSLLLLALAHKSERMYF